MNAKKMNAKQRLNPKVNAKKSFTELLMLVKKMLPKDNTLPFYVRPELTPELLGSSGSIVKGE